MSICRAYERSLQCLHFALEDCPPTDFHLQMMGARLGHVRDLMEDICTRIHSMDFTTKSSTTRTVERATTPQPASTTSTVSTFYEVKILDNSKDTGVMGKSMDVKPSDSIQQHLSYNKYKEGNDITPLKTKKLQDKDKLSRPAQVNEVLAKKNFWKDSDVKMVAGFDTPEMKAQTSNCHGPNAETNPACWDMYFNSALHTSSSWIWLSLTVIVTAINVMLS